MIKKLAMVAVALAIAAPVFAVSFSFPSTTTIGNVYSNVNTSSNTGANTTSGLWFVLSKTGNAVAGANVKTKVASGASLFGSVTTLGTVNNNVNTSSNTGYNQTIGGSSKTGNAMSFSTVSTSVVSY